MTSIAAQNFKPFGPAQAGVDRAARPLTAAVPGNAGRFATGPKSEHDQLVDKTRSWVSLTFFGTLLKQMRDSPFKSELFSGGQGGQAFGGLYDQQLADHMARGAGSKLVNSIVRRIEANSAYRKQASVEGTSRGDNLTDDRRNDKPQATRSHVPPTR